MKDSDIKIVGLANNKVKGKTNWKITGALIGIVVLALGVVAGIILVRQQQDIREKADTTTYGSCSDPTTEACPGSDGVLRSCHPPESDNSPVLSICETRFTGRKEFCGTRDYCCNGISWTTNMTPCLATATPTATATATATSTSKSTSVATSSGSPKASATATAFPVPETGASVPTKFGIAAGIILVITSLSLAF